MAKNRLREPEPPKPKFSKKWISVIIVIIMCSSLLTYTVVHLNEPPKLITVATKGSGISIDNQEIVSFFQNFTKLVFTVKVSAQNDSFGFGPGYWLNGLTKDNYWYQVGIAYDWGGWNNSSGDYYKGFAFVYEVFDPTGTSIFPQVNGGAGVLSMNIRNEDEVVLSMKFSSDSSDNKVIMSAYDKETGSSRSISYWSFGADSFLGVDNVSNKLGFWTGIMTEWWHPDWYNGTELPVTYLSSVGKIQYVSLQIVVGRLNGKTVIQSYGNYTTSPINLYDYPNGYIIYHKSEKIIATPSEFTTD